MRVVSLIVTALALASSTTAQTRYTWVGGSSGDWTEATNWSPTGVPSTADTAVVGDASQGRRLAMLTANTTVAGLQMLGQGEVGGDFDLTVTARFLWAAGGAGLETFRGTGTITNAASSTLHMAEPTTEFEMGAGRTLVNDGTILWDGAGNWNGGGRLVNNGDLELAMGETDSFGFVFSSLADAITNTASGVIRRTGEGSAGWASGSVNDGVIRVEQGTLDLAGFNLNGIQGTGQIQVEPGGGLTITGGNHAQGEVAGDALTINRGQMRIAGDYDVATTHIESSGVLWLDGTSSMETLTMAGGTLEGEGTLTVTGTLDWTGGRMQGSGTTVLGPTIPLAIGGDASISLGGTRTFRTEGPTTWTGNADLSAGSSTTVFENAGTMTSSGPGERVTFFVTFRNTGTLIHDGGTLSFQGPMSNEGEVRIDDGTLEAAFSSTGTDTGRYEIGDTGRLEFASQQRTLDEGAEITGTGTVAVTSTTVTNHATWKPGSPVGLLVIDSSWPQPRAGAVLEIEIGGTDFDEFDKLQVNGSTMPSGALRVTLVDGFQPQVGDRFRIMFGTGLGPGSFSPVELPDGLTMDQEQTALGLELVVTAFVADEDAPGLPPELALHAPAPNPTRGTSSMQVDLPSPARIRLSVYDALGREVAVALDEERPAGTHTIALTTDALAPGVYVVRLVAGADVYTQTVTVAR